MKYWCAANSNLAYFIELTTALECQKQLLMSSISNLGGRESLEIAVKQIMSNFCKSKCQLIGPIFAAIISAIFSFGRCERVDSLRIWPLKSVIKEIHF